MNIGHAHRQQLAHQLLQALARNTGSTIILEIFEFRHGSCFSEEHSFSTFRNSLFSKGCFQDRK